MKTLYETPSLHYEQLFAYAAILRISHPTILEVTSESPNQFVDMEEENW